MRSCIYEGWVRHRRFAPVTNAFRYRVCMMHIDLAEAEGLFRGRWLWSVNGLNVACLLRRDHLGEAAQPLDLAVRDLVERRLGRRPTGPITLLTHLRYFGYVMNPVSFYYCWGEDGAEVEAIVAEVNNTPWGERHCYVLDATRHLGRGVRRRFRFDKDFHVSPFMPTQQRYDWRLTDPGERLTVHMENHDAGACVLDATLVMRRRPITTANLARVLWRYPLMTAQVITKIYFQALRLWLKRCPSYTHPKNLTPRKAATR